MNVALIVQYWNFRFARRDWAMRERAESPVSRTDEGLGGLRRPNHRPQIARKALVHAFGICIP